MKHGHFTCGGSYVHVGGHMILVPYMVRGTIYTCGGPYDTYSIYGGPYVHVQEPYDTCSL